MADEVLNIAEEYEVVDNTKLYIAMKRKSDGFLIAATEAEYDALDKRSYTTKGIIIRNEEEDVNLLVAPVEESHFFGEGPEDIPETDKRRKNYVSPSMTQMDGEWRTDFLLNEAGEEHSDDCALCYTKAYSPECWLPSGGEMSKAYSYLEELNRLMGVIGGTEIQSGNYWTSTQYSKDYAWFANMEDGTFGFWLSKTNSLNVRPMADGSDYEATVTE